MRVVIALDVGDGKERQVTQINPGDVWTIAMRSLRPEGGAAHKDQSIGFTPKVYTIPVEGQPTRVVGVGCKNGGFYVLRADDGRIIARTPCIPARRRIRLLSEAGPADARPTELPQGAYQTGCATDGRTIFTNGIDALRLASQATPDVSALLNIINIMQHGPVSGGRVVA